MCIRDSYYTEDLAIPAELKDYFDYGAYGRDVSINEGGHFAPGGYIVQTGDVKEYYYGIQDLSLIHISINKTVKIAEAQSKQWQ